MGGRRPIKEWRERRKRETLERAIRGEATEIELANFRAMLNRMWRDRGRREEWMIAPNLIFELVEAYVRRRPSLADTLKKHVDRALSKLVEKKRKFILEKYRSEWIKYGEEWLRTFLEHHPSLLHNANFKSVDDCLNWPYINPPRVSAYPNYLDTCLES